MILIEFLFFLKKQKGLFKDAIKDYTAVISIKPDHVSWYQREIALWVWGHLDEPVSSFNIDVELDKYFKESWCKRHHPDSLGTNSNYFRRYSLCINLFFFLLSSLYTSKNSSKCN